MAVFGAIVFLSASVLITVESVDPVLVCPTYVPETGTLQCECTVPKAIGYVSNLTLSWPGTNATSNALTVADVQRKANGTRYTCQMVVNGTTTTSVYTLQVAYGPANNTTKITGPSPFLTDGTKHVTLTCEATEVNPIPKYSWIGVNCDNGNQSNTCTFRPSFAHDDGKVVTCTAENPVSLATVTKIAWTAFTLRLQEVTTKSTPAPITTVARTTPAPTTAAQTTAPPTEVPPITTAAVTSAPATTTSTARVTTVLPVTSAPIITIATSPPVTTAAPVTTATSTSTTTTSAPVTTATATSAPVTTAKVTASASVVTTTAGQGTSTEETDTQGSTPGTDYTNTTPSSGTETPTTEGAAPHTAPPIGVIVGCSVGAFILILVVFAICCTRRRSKKKHVNLKNAENNKGQARQAYVNKGYLTLDMTNDSSQSAATKPTNSSPSATVIEQNDEPKNKMATNKENGTNTGFGYSPLSDNVSHVTSSEARGDEVKFTENPIFDMYFGVIDTEPSQSNHAVTEFELSSPAGGNDYAEVTKEPTANIDVEEASNEGGTDLYAVVNKTKSREPEEEDEDQVPEVAGPDGDMYAVVRKSSAKRNDSH